MQIGTEHEYSINDKDFSPLPISDKIIEGISGSVEHEVSLGEVKYPRSCRSMLMELIPSRPGSLSFLEDNLYRGLLELYRVTNHRVQVPGAGNASLAQAGPDLHTGTTTSRSTTRPTTGCSTSGSTAG